MFVVLQGQPYVYSRFNKEHLKPKKQPFLHVDMKNKTHNKYEAKSLQTEEKPSLFHIISSDVIAICDI